MNERKGKSTLLSRVYSETSLIKSLTSWTQSSKAEQQLSFCVSNSSTTGKSWRCNGATLSADPTPQAPSTVFQKIAHAKRFA